MNTPQLKAVDAGGSFIVDGEPLTRVEPGLYDLAYLYYETRYLHNRSPKLVVWFKIVSMGKGFDKKVARYYNVNRIKGKARKYGDFKVGPKSDFIREFFSVITTPAPRLDRIPMTAMKEVVIKAKLDLVTAGHNQRPIPELLQYSVVRQLIGVADK